ncbi:MAG: glycosyltransferase family 1 protein [Bryobacteraceae bacterium]
MKPPRLALFADCYHEVNGVANTVRHLERYAVEQQLPVLCVRSGGKTRLVRDGAFGALELRRSPLCFPVDRDLEFDLLLNRHLPRIKRELTAFRPDVIHITGPGDIGIAGMLASRILRAPLVASWHTNVHEFAARRLEQLLAPVPARTRQRVCASGEQMVWRLLTLYYRAPSLLFAPNPELIEALARDTGRRVLPMPRGIDTALFHPSRRRRPEGEVVFGYVGRLTPEKNVRLLVEVDRALRTSGRRGYRFLIVGDGGERPALERELPGARFTGVLRGEALAEAYASMDLLLFPSHTDTFGNVALEAQASGVPVLATADGGPKFLVEDGRTGWVAGSDDAFVRKAVEAAARPSTLSAMGPEARASVLSRSWDQVFSDLYGAYGAVVTASGAGLRSALYGVA